MLSWVFSCGPALYKKLLSRDRVSRTRPDVISTNFKLPKTFYCPFLFFSFCFLFLNSSFARCVEKKQLFPVNQPPPPKKKLFVRPHLQRHRILCPVRRRRGGRSLKRTVCQLKTLVSAWIHSVQEEHIRQCTEEQLHMTKCQVYLTANSFLWSGTEYMKRISLLQCVWQRSLVFSTVKHVPDDHPCVNPDSEQS